MKIAIVGSREWPADKFDYIANRLDRFLTMSINKIIISGGARGVDTFVIEEAKKRHFETKVYPADWDKHGKKAGYLRNLEMVKEADLVVAFWDGKSPGTKHTIDLALAHKKRLEVIFP